MGGLTVLAALRRVLPEEQFIFLGDSARFPYGTKSPRTVPRYARQATGLLVERGIKALVVACNTASAFALAKLAADYDPLPVFGVLEPGAAAASAATAQGPILVLATESTIRGGGYQRALLTLRPEIAIYGRACPLWVTLAEQDHPNQALVDRILLDALRGFPAVGDPAGITVLLGCTHFPVFRTLRNALWAHEIASCQGVSENRGSHEPLNEHLCTHARGLCQRQGCVPGGF